MIHTDICGPFDAPSFGGENYFITFIDDFSRYCYLYLLHENSQSVDVLETFINEVERQLDRKVKVVRSDMENLMKVDNVKVHLKSYLKVGAYMHNI